MEVHFEYQPSGKPALAAQQNPHGLEFNVSHSAGLALIAVSAGHRVGVDIEKIRSEVDTTALAERFFSVRERTGLRVLPDHLRVPAFFACWTRKESFLKATGQGLSFPLVDFSVTTHPDLDPALEEIRGNTEARKQWFLADLSVASGYRATVAIEGAFVQAHWIAGRKKGRWERRLYRISQCDCDIGLGDQPNRRRIGIQNVFAARTKDKRERPLENSAARNGAILSTG